MKREIEGQLIRWKDSKRGKTLFMNASYNQGGVNRLKNQIFFINEFIRFANIVPAQTTKSKIAKAIESSQTERKAWLLNYE